MHAAGIGIDTELTGDGSRGQHLIAGDHHGGDAGGAALGHRLLRLLTQWIDHADKADVNQLTIEVFLLIILWQLPVSESDDAQSPRGQFPVQAADLLPVHERYRSFSREPPRAR